jgi:hypothetical protein
MAAKIKNSRRPPKLDLLIKSTNRFFIKNLLLNKISKHLIFIDYFFSQKFKMACGAHIQYGVFLDLFLKTLTFVKNFKIFANFQIKNSKKKLLPKNRIQNGH